MAQIDVKELRVVDTGTITWFDDKEGNTVVFPTAESFVAALVENGEFKTSSLECLKNEIQYFKEAVEKLGSIEEAIKFMHGMDMNLTEEQEDELLVEPQPVFAFIDYCLYNGVHYEEITKYTLSDRFYGTEASELCSNPVFIDPEKQGKYWYMKEDEISYGEEIIMYKLSPEEQEQLQKQLKELRDSGKCFNLCDCELYVKGMVLLLEEILETFGE